MTVLADIPQVANDTQSRDAAVTNETAHRYLAQAVSLVKSGEVKKGRAELASVLRKWPNFPLAWLEAGELAATLGRLNESIHCFKQVTKIDPHNWSAWLGLARDLEAQSKWDDAARCYHRALQFNNSPANTQGELHRGSPCKTHILMARYRVERGDTARALESLRQALEQLKLESSPQDANQYAEIQLELGNVFMRLGLVDSAHRAFEQASTTADEGLLTRLAKISFHHNLWHEAQQVLQRCVHLHPLSATALWNLAHAYVEAWKLEEAELTLKKAEKLAPQNGAKAMRASIAGRRGNVQEALDLYLELVKVENNNSSVRSCAAMTSLYNDSLVAGEVFKLHKELFSDWGEKSRKATDFSRQPIKGRKLKVGIMSADLHHQHPVNLFMQPVLARLDRQRFATYVYNTGEAHDDQTTLAKSRSTFWRDATFWSPNRLANEVLNDEIDVLIDLAGHTANNRLELFATRLAPVQVAFLGYPGTTGVPNIDWLIADHTVVPPSYDHLYSERVYRLPNTVFCYSPEVEYQYPHYDPNQANRPLTYGSFNNVAKLTPSTIELWSRVLKETPDSRMILKAPSFGDASAINIFIKRFEEHGIAENRLIFRGPTSLSEMMLEYEDIDIALDSIPYNGGTTTLQALWMGVPVITLEGHNFASRMGASFLKAADLQDWIAKSKEQYVDIAAQKIRDREILFQLKRNLRRRLTNSKAWNIEQYVRDFEAALESMWDDFWKNHANKETAK